MKDIINNINSILGKLYSSIINDGFELLDKITGLNSKMLNTNTLKLFKDNIDSINAIVMCLFIGLFIFFILKYIISLYSDVYILSIYSLIIRTIIVAIICTNSIYICSTILDIHYELYQGTKKCLEEISKENIQYIFLKEDIKTLEDFFKSTNKIGLKGIKDSILCTYIILLIVSFSCRYIVVILCIILSPFFLMFLISNKTIKYALLWFKTFIIALFLETVNIIIIFIPITSNKDKELYPVILLGSMFIMYKVNKKIGDFTK